jgi:hypothetical protein
LQVIGGEAPVLRPFKEPAAATFAGCRSRRQPASAGIRLRSLAQPVHERANFHYVSAQESVIMGPVAEKACPFCDIAKRDVIAQVGPCAAIWTREPPAGSLMVIPLR